MENLRFQIKFLQEIEAKEIIEDATEQARRIIKEAEEKAAKIKSQKTKEVSENLHEKEAAELDSARLEEKKKISNAKSQLQDEALTQAMEKLKKISIDSSARYQESLKKLIIKAAAEIRATDLEILINSRDREFIKDRLAELKKDISRLKGAQVSLKVGEETLNTIGGAIVRDKDKRQIFNSTLEAGLTKARQELLGEISASLFEDIED
jgi:V/A-type H+-transporting ATPase subunit E